MKSIYLDHAATTPIDTDVLMYMQAFWNECYGNPSSLHERGRRAMQAIQEARERVALCLGAYPDEIVFTGSGTESDNLAVLGVVRAQARYHNHVIVSAIEHKAILEAVSVLHKEGVALSVAPVNNDGLIDVQQVCSLVRDETSLVSIMLANNEIGTIEPISELVSSLLNQKRQTGFPLVHTDACQAAGHISINTNVLGVDLMTLNGSKIYGPKGIGALYKKRSVRIVPVIVGGGQENGIRAGTESVPLIMGFVYALEKAERLRKDEHKRLSNLRKYFVDGLRRCIPDIRINGHTQTVLPHIVHVTVPGVEGESMVLMLDERGVAVATGSACSANDLRPSHVLIAIGHHDDLIHGSIRFSFGRDTTQGDLAYVLRVFPSIVEQLKKTSFLTSNLYAKEKYNV